MYVYIYNDNNNVMIMYIYNKTSLQFKLFRYGASPVLPILITAVIRILLHCMVLWVVFLACQPRSY